jgi:hypothetical protein
MKRRVNKKRLFAVLGIAIGVSAYVITLFKVSTSMEDPGMGLAVWYIGGPGVAILTALTIGAISFIMEEKK